MRKEKIEPNELLPPQKLETLFIDIKNKKFLLNGREFGKKCKHISISCSPPEWRVNVIIEQPIEFASKYDLNGNQRGKTLISQIIPIE